ncbi:hypothetical protein PPL_10516 [Heterostelium album PN500]|uniref:Uncharacterized protein n=1 Tax=Heterostelium pallidum (strain ATCC 26659 / Pp 5 / PN500) TaxID=670386 RepID=D3BRA9_HETP5|nr:hypothetical protein PPL_10516 [Heterostelium album PN500]EFA75941.1 hypothetical protein PPL_10516 [Heterostelium album PN500]|eukprot:XP_020428075.1 hypothetical protein PPL_10516 [Heterostelium album PN500]
MSRFLIIMNTSKALIDITTTITRFEKESEDWKDKYIKVIEDNKKHIDRLEEDIKKHISTIDDLSLKVENLQTQIDQLKATRKNFSDKLLLGELGRQIEKAICKHILGDNTRINTLYVMFSLLKSDKSFKTNWSNLMSNVGWNNNLYQTILDLKDLHLNECHPTTCEDGSSLTSDYLQNIASNYIKGQYKSLILQDIKTLLNILESFNKQTLFFGIHCRLTCWLFHYVNFDYKVDENTDY